ncbi:MAG: LLM class flavin-dependent oxidoreductase [Acholeplasmataceae bacterium]
MKFGMMTFLETGANQNGPKISDQKRIKNALEEIVLADQVGIDFYGIGEHHRNDYASSSPQIILAAAAPLTKRIMLGTAVTVLSSDDPIRLYEQFSTLDLISDGRAEMIAGRGSFTESFPLFGYDLEDYNGLFTEKLELLLKAKHEEIMNWSGKYRKPLINQSAYPRDIYDLKIGIGVGGTYQSVVRAAKLGLPITFAIIGGNPLNFKPLIDLYKHSYKEAGHDLDKMEISIAIHGMISENVDDLLERYYPVYRDQFEKIGSERGWNNHISYQNFLAYVNHGPLIIGNQETVVKRMYHMIKGLGVDRFIYQMPGSIMPHEMTMESIKTYGEIIIPALKELLNEKE